MKKVIYLTERSVPTDKEDVEIEKLRDKRTKVIVMNSQFINPKKPPKADSFEGVIPKGFVGTFGKANEIKKESEQKSKEQSEKVGGEAKKSSTNTGSKSQQTSPWKPN